MPIHTTDVTDIWIFGYGSLIWKNNDFEFEYCEPGYIKGFHRRFYQDSIDHRGTHEKPGRVVTLIKTFENDPNAIVYGMGFKLPQHKASDILNYLDEREINGYQRCSTLFYPINHDTTSIAMVYIANESNPSWNNQHNLTEIADQIFYAEGKSGKNIDYVFNLCNIMREKFPGKSDNHLFELETILKNKLNS